MKKYNVLFFVAALIYLCFAGILFGIGTGNTGSESMAYKVEVHEVMRQLEQGRRPLTIDLSDYQYLKDVVFLPEEECESKEDSEKLTEFYAGKNGLHSCIKPLILDGTKKGYVRFDYIGEKADYRMLIATEIVLFLVFLFIFGLLFYIRNHILKPFHAIREMPYELSKGHLNMELTENKNRLFGKFIWGLGMLRDSLSDSKAKELKLLKEKKLLLLSISHDIKIPLSAIKLYTKALKEDIYDTEEKKREAVTQIEVHTNEIESFVKEIVSASSEEIITIEVKNTEFYLKALVEKVSETYAPKAQVALMNFEVKSYENKLIKGDFEKAFEVIENLMENAFKYGDGKQIIIDFYEEEYCQVIRIFNTGSVVPVTEFPHLFDSFFRGSNVGNKAGNGLGLYISKQIMHKMGGEIFAERKEDGMAFCVVFEM
ncbi:MAG: HAMP domain-containing sensor histidine kinase [Lachnospiraceae bacterium]|nr:HAMP domain-containing sensor histidine kinase [Lachnospiraceae bacterium]